MRCGGDGDGDGSGDGVVIQHTITEDESHEEALLWSFRCALRQTYAVPHNLTQSHLGVRLGARLGQHFLVTSRRRLLIPAAVALRATGTAALATRGKSIGDKAGCWQRTSTRL